MDINSNIYNSFNYGSYNSSSVYATRDTQFRGGVTGWEPKESSSSHSNSPTVSSDVSDYLSSVKEFGSVIGKALSTLTGENQSSVFDRLKGSSSNEDALTARVTNQSKASAFNDENGSKGVEVQQLAAAQRNEGGDLSAARINGLGSGSKQFSIETGGKEFQFNVNVNTTDSNRTVQEKMAAAINKQNTGVTASVSYDEKTNTSSLILSADSTGTKESFQIKDTNGGNIVSAMGADNVATAARDARYTVDGVQKTSSSNDADLGDGISATLKKTTDEAVTVSAAEDETDITNAVYEMVNGFNQLRETALNANEDKDARALQGRLDSLMSAYSNTLENIGVTANEYGYMEIDKEKLGEAVKSGQVEETLGSSSSFSRSLSSVASQAESNPERFLSFQARKNASSDDSSNGDYSGFGNLGGISFSPRQSASITQWNNVGMLFSAWG